MSDPKKDIKLAKTESCTECDGKGYIIMGHQRCFACRGSGYKITGFITISELKDLLDAEQVNRLKRF
jgi:DnaJ-class molecular chaperone